MAFLEDGGRVLWLVGGVHALGAVDGDRGDHAHAHNGLRQTRHEVSRLSSLKIDGHFVADVHAKALRELAAKGYFIGGLRISALVDGPAALRGGIGIGDRK